MTNKLCFLFTGRSFLAGCFKLCLLQVCFVLFMPDGYAQSHKFERLMHFGNPDQIGRISCGDVYKNRTIVTDDDGYLYVTGNFRSDIDFDPGAGSTVLNSYITGGGLDSQGRYIARFAPDGSLLWVRQFGNDLTSSSNIITAIDVDSMKNVYIVGHFAGIFNAKLVPDDSAVTPVGSREGVIIKVDSNGNHVWTKTIHNVYVHGITVNRQEGTIYATGASSGIQDFDPGAGPADTAWLAAGGYLLKWDTDGRYIWAKSWPGATGYGIGYDPSGNVYLTGKFSGANRNFNPDPSGTQTLLSASGSSDIFVSSFDANGGFRWASGFGAAGQEESYSLETDAQGNSYFTGVFQDTVDFGGYEVRTGRNPTNPASRVMEVFIAKIDNAGAIQWASQLEGVGSNWGYALTLGKGPAKGVYATGVIRGAAAMNNPGNTTTLTPASSAEAFLVSLDENTGHFNWGGVLGAGSCGSLAMDPQGDLYAAGYLSNTYNRVDFDPGPDTFFSDRIGISDGWITKLRFCHSSDTLRLTSCGNYAYDGNTYNQTGVYVHINPKGCDTSSKLVLDLTIYHLDPRISVNGNILTATPGFDSYQWLRDDTLIQGATSSSYTVTKNGRYQVVVTSNSICTDTSDSYSVNNIGIRISDAADQVSVYPNPASDHVYINSPAGVHVQITTMDGRSLYDGMHRSGAISLKGLASGMYLLHIRDLDHRLIRTEKLIRQ